MYDNLLAANSKYPAEAISQDDLSELKLLEVDNISNLLFLIGTLIAMYATSEAEKEIVRPEDARTSSRGAATPISSRNELLILFNILFLIGTILLAYTVRSRIDNQKADISRDSSQVRINNFTGNEIVLSGIIFRIVGYVFAIIGNKIKADNPL
jgi:hypothetical protein